ncbi:MAG: hypothetical protein ABR562_09705, partial [Thermoplasmatota archaeon]
FVGRASAQKGAEVAARALGALERTHGLRADLVFAGPAEPRARDELAAAGHVFRTRCDTEVHVHLYEEHGPGYVERLRGMFAVALWDTRARRLVLARDRFGIKPLYYRHVGDELRFASELRALPRGEIDVDEAARRLQEA